MTPESLEQMRDVIPQLLNTLDANALSQDFQTPLQPTGQRRRPLRRS